VKTIDGLVISLSLTLTLIYGCQTADAQEQSRSSNGEQKGYLYSDSNNATFIQLTRAGRRIKGQMQIFFIRDVQAGLVNSDSLSFEGMMDGENITLTLKRDGTPSWLSGGKTITGTLIPGKLRLVWPAPDGTLTASAYTSGTVEDYNKVVLTLRNQAAVARMRYLKARAESNRIAAEKQAVVDAHNRVTAATESLRDALKDLPGAEWYGNALRCYTSNWQRMQEDHAALLAESKKPLIGGQLGIVQGRLGTLSGDLGSISGCRGSLDGDLSRANARIQDAKEGERQLRATFAQLRQAVAANTTGEPRATVTADHIFEAVEFARSEINKAVAERDDAHAKAKDYDRQADELYRQAEAFVKTLKAANR
jgi:hypothetical protein